MRRYQFFPAFLCLGLFACQGLDSLRGDELGHSEQASIGGSPAVGQAHYDAVAAITVLRPRDPESAAPRDKYRYCTGVLVGERSVLTAAECIFENVEAELEEANTDANLDDLSVVIQFGPSPSEGTEFHLDSDFDGDPQTTKGVTIHRYYKTGFRGRNDMAVLHLDADPGITPVKLNTAAVGSEIAGQETLELVGYGRNGEDTNKDTHGTRTVIAPEIVEVTPTRIVAGSDDLRTCHADGGGPGFLDVEGEMLLATVNERQSGTDVNSGCKLNASRERVDLHATSFIEPIVKIYNGECSNNACDDCDYNGTCKEDCPTRDWDCELGVFTGEACEQNGECEEFGSCVPATDDPAFTYCSKPCASADANSCPPEMECSEAGSCVYAGISPGSQGATCTSPGACRSNFCEGGFCANVCDPTDANACDLDSGFSCLPSVTDGETTVCRVQISQGGGGFCSTGGGRNSSQGLLAFVGMLLLAGLLRRKTQRA